MARVYRLGKRAAKMAETRQRVLESAYLLLRDEGLAGLSLEEVAKQAGVGRTTLFIQFGSRAGLLRELEQHVSERAGVGGLRAELAHDDALRVLGAAFEVGCRVWDAERAAFHQLFSLSAIDPELHEVMEAKDAVRRALVADLVKGLQRQGHLQGSPQRARDLLLLLTSFGSFEALRREGRTPEAVARMLREMAETLLLTKG